MSRERQKCVRMMFSWSLTASWVQWIPSGILLWIWWVIQYIVQVQARVNISDNLVLFGSTKNLVSHPVVQVQHIKAKGSRGEGNHQVSLHHIEPNHNNSSIDNDFQVVPHAPPLELHALHHEAAPHLHGDGRSAKPDQLGLVRESALNLLAVDIFERPSRRIFFTSSEIATRLNLQQRVKSSILWVNYTEILLLLWAVIIYN